MRRIRQLAVAGVVAGLVSLSWMTLVSVLPAAHRPYIDGSHDNSAYEQVFVYNGFGRFGDQTPLQLLAGQQLGISSALPTPALAPDRLLRGDLGRDTGWLLPAALIIAGWGIVSRRRQPRGDPLRSCFILWGGWLVTLAVTFSLTTTINPYYTAALTPAVAALLGAGAAAARTADRAAPGGRIGLAVAGGRHGGLRRLAGRLGRGQGTGLAAARGHRGRAWPRWPRRWPASWSAGRRCWRRRWPRGWSPGAAAPAVASATLVLRHQGSFDTPFEPARQDRAIRDLFVVGAGPGQAARSRSSSRPGSARRTCSRRRAPALASVFIYDTGLEALPIGGFTGTIPSPTLGQLQADIRQGKFHLVLAGTTARPAAGLDRRGTASRWRATSALRHNTSACPPSGAERPRRPGRP